MDKKIEIYPELLAFIEKVSEEYIPEKRQLLLRPLIEYCSQKTAANEELQLNFICTHNSRRSQLAQAWGQLAAASFGVPVQCFSGGTEATTFNETAVTVLQKAGFRIAHTGNENPRYKLAYSPEGHQVTAFSKRYDHEVNPISGFAAVMTCSHADENCPYIPGAEARFALDYADPKEFDGTDLEVEKYRERSLQIAAEMFFVFKNVKSL